MNAVFGKVLRIATEETILYFISAKCMPILLHGLDACPVHGFLTKFMDNRVLNVAQSLA